MKKTVLLLVIALFVNVTFVKAKELNPKRSYTKTYAEISGLLTPKYPIGELKGITSVKVNIIITPKNEILVLQTETNDEVLSEYIKENLNYKRLLSDELVKGNSYVFEVKFES